MKFRASAFKERAFMAVDEFSSIPLNSIVSTTLHVGMWGYIDQGNDQHIGMWRHNNQNINILGKSSEI